MIQPVGGGGGGCRPLSADSAEGGVLSAVGRFCGGGRVLSAVGRFCGGEGAVRCRPIQLVCAVRFNKWEVRMKARGGQLQTSLYKLKSQGGPTADFTVQT